MNTNDTNLHNHLSSARIVKSLPPIRVIPDPDGFTYTLVHEIRNPITNIKLATQVLKQIVKDENQNMYLDIIIRNSARVNDLVADLLTSQDTYGMIRNEHSFQDLLEEILSLNDDRFILNNVTVSKSYTALNITKEFDRPRMKIALTNIIINAIEAMPVKNAHLEITTKLLRGFYFIVIKDNGAGISKENLDNIFKPYYSNKPGGIGLGLSNTLSILHSNHIEVNVRSEPGKGTRFILSFKK
jgi:signal transduction histidine kinase